MLSVAGGLGDQPGPAQGIGQRPFRGGVAPAAPLASPLAAAPAPASTPALARPGTAPAPAAVLVLRRAALAALAAAGRAAP
jgi:hypothetical protein